MTVEYNRIFFKDQDEWLKLRKKGIGGSDIAAICGISPYKSAFSVYMEKTGQYNPVVSNNFVYWGNVLEETIKKEFCKQNDLKVIKPNCIMQSKKYPFLLASIDGRIVGENTGLEIKTTSIHNSKIWDVGVPDYYEMQVQHYMAVTGWDSFHVVVLIGGNDYRHYIIKKDQEVIDYIIKIATEFVDYMDKKIVPIATEKDLDCIDTLYPKAKVNGVIEANPEIELVISDYKAISEQIKDLDNQKKAKAARIKEYIKDNELMKSSRYKVTYKNTTKTGYNVKQAIEDGINLSDYETIYSSRRLDIRAIKGGK